VVLPEKYHFGQWANLGQAANVTRNIDGDFTWLTAVAMVVAVSSGGFKMAGNL
jgi:hypothetical protein